MRVILPVMCLLIFGVCSLNNVLAQSDDEDVNLFQKNENYIMVGYDLYGVRNSFGSSTKGYGPLTMNYERGLTNRIGLGLRFSTGKFSNTVDTDSSVYIGPLIPWEVITETNVTQYGSAYFRANYHINMGIFNNPIFHDLDLYVGGGAGYNYVISNISHSIPYPSDGKTTSGVFDYEVVGGFRFYVREHFGFYGEFGRAHSGSQYGMVFKF